MLVRTIACAIAGLTLIGAVSSYAADLPVRVRTERVDYVVPRTWSGLYVGLFAGYGWGRARATEPTDPALVFPFYNGTNDPYSFNVSGFFGGGTIGYNVQSGALVYGLEGEVGYLGLRGSEIDPNGTIFFGTPDTVTTFKSDAYGALYGRLGFVQGAALFYGKGGVAALNARATTIDPCAGTPGCGTTTLNMTGSKVMIGWSAGAGVEWMLSPAWSVKAEYAFFDFGRIATAGPSSTAGEFYTQNIRVWTHTAKFGVNYRWGGGPLIARY
jgi:outer membrane immunogenic protein